MTPALRVSGERKGLHVYSTDTAREEKTMSAPHDRPTNEPGGCQCERCGVIFVGAEHHSLCAVCFEKDPTPAWAYDDDNEYDEDDYDPIEDCGMTQDGHCMLAGTEFCDWDCPRGRS